MDAVRAFLRHPSGMVGLVVLLVVVIVAIIAPVVFPVSPAVDGSVGEGAVALVPPPD